MIDGTTKKFTIINMSNDDVFIDEYIKTFKEVDRIHKWRNHNYVVTLCPVLTEGDRDCRKFLELVRGDFAIHVVTLGNNWKGNDSIDQSLANEICKSLRTKNQLYCREVINKQSALFNQRAEKIRQYLIKNSN